MALQSITPQGTATQATNGIFETAGNLYSVLANFTSNKLECYKSTDQGVTWTQKDAAHAIGLTLNNFAVVIVGTILYVVYDDTSSVFMTVLLFDTATDLWSSKFVSTNGLLQNNSAGLAYRASDGCLIFAGQPTSLSVTPDRSRNGWFKFNITTHVFSAWSAFGDTAPGYTFACQCYAVVAGNGCVHFIICESGNDGLGGVGAILKQQALSNLDVLGPLQTIDDQSALTVGPITFPSAASDGTNLMIGWCPQDFANSNTISTFKGASAAAAPIVFTAQTINTILPNTFQNAAIAIKAGIFYVSMCTNDGGVNFIAKTYADSGAGFDTGTILVTVAFFIFSRWASPVTFATYAILIEGSAWFLAPAAPIPPAVVAGNPRMNMPSAIYLPDAGALCGAPALDCIDDPDCLRENLQLTKGVTGKFQ